MQILAIKSTVKKYMCVCVYMYIYTYIYIYIYLKQLRNATEDKLKLAVGG